MKFIIANWKMNHGFDDCDKWLEEFISLYGANYQNFQNKKIIVAPPTILLDYLDSTLMEGSLLNLENAMANNGKSISDFNEDELNDIIFTSRPISLAGQDCHHQISGSFTGDVSARSLKEVGCEYVILGHSERRQYHKESNQIISQKIACALSQKLTPIICIGESLETRKQNNHLEFIAKQISETLANNIFDNLIIAYEPIWSIGTGVIANNNQILEVANFIQKIFASQLNKSANNHFLLYGGSVNSQNSKEILNIAGVNGLLVGKASLDSREFYQICA